MGYSVSIKNHNYEYCGTMERYYYVKRAEHKILLPTYYNYKTRLGNNIQKEY
jgi:hypothetical protein